MGSQLEVLIHALLGSTAGKSLRKELEKTEDGKSLLQSVEAANAPTIAMSTQRSRSELLGETK